MIEPGQYTFPFMVKLPIDMPSSLYFFGDSGSEACIKYSLKASLVKSENSDIKPMYYKQTLIVRQRPYDVNVGESDRCEVPISLC
jgi:hypothetical protein